MSKITNDSIRTSIRGFMLRSFEGREVADHDDIFALGFGNSLFAIQLVAYVEREFDIELKAEDLEMDNFRSIEAVAALVGRRREE